MNKFYHFQVQIQGLILQFFSVINFITCRYKFRAGYYSFSVWLNFITFRYKFRACSCSFSMWLNFITFRYKFRAWSCSCSVWLNLITLLLIQGLILQFFNVIKFYHFHLLIQGLMLKFFIYNVKLLMCCIPVSHNMHSLFQNHRTAPESRASGPTTLWSCYVWLGLCLMFVQGGFMFMK